MVRREGRRARPSQSPRIVFLHIPKTGGSTFARVLSRQYAPQERITQVGTGREGRRGFHERLAALPEAHPVRLVRGPLWFGVHEVLPGSWTYITLLRDPVDRALSIYFHYVRRQGLTASLEEWVAEGKDFDLDNGQTRRLSGIEVEDLAFGECSPEVLELAKRNLEEHFAVAGLTERFDETLILLRRTFGWRNLLYARTNVGTNRTPTHAIPRDVLDRIEGLNRFDTELYRFAVKRFDEHVAGQHPPIEGELERFRRWNAAYERLYRLAAPAGRPIVRLIVRRRLSSRARG